MCSYASCYHKAMRHLEDVLQQLHDSEINVTITMLWGSGFDFAFASYLQFPDIGTPIDDLESFVQPKPERRKPTLWHNCPSASDLAEAIHKAALENYPRSNYAKLYA